MIPISPCIYVQLCVIYCNSNIINPIVTNHAWQVSVLSSSECPVQLVHHLKHDRWHRLPHSPFRRQRVSTEHNTVIHHKKLFVCLEETVRSKFRSIGI